jgi:methanogenic corrinoid protein MtbC1
MIKITKTRVTGENMTLTKDEIIDSARHAVIDLDESAVERIANEALEAGMDPVDLIEQGFIEGLKSVGDLFEEGKSQISRVLEASHIVNSGINALKPAIVSSDSDFCQFGNLIVGI